MSSRWKYSCITVILLMIAIGLSQIPLPQHYREHQHLEYNVAVEDTNLSIDPDTFSSRLPVIDIQTGGVEIPGKPAVTELVSQMPNVKSRAKLRIIDKEGVLHTLQDDADVVTEINIRIRGNTSRRFPKSGYLFECVDVSGNSQKLSLMGMEIFDEWVLHGPFLDKTLMRNYMWYNLAGQVMEWAPDVRFCEVFIDNVYKGVYLLTEKPSVGEGRIEVTKYRRNADFSSYLLCYDRTSINTNYSLNSFTDYAIKDSAYIAANPNCMEILYPSDRKMTEELYEYIRKDFSDFEKSLYSYDFDSEKYGYASFIDVNNFVDYFLINEIAKNADAGLYSTFFYKDIHGKIKMCVWDFNNCCDNFQEESVSVEGFFLPKTMWFEMLCRDEKFVDKVIDRYENLRRNVFSDSSVSDYIMSVQEYLGTAIDRNYQVWGDTFIPEKDFMPEGRKIASYEEAVQQYETWLLRRLEWLDNNIESLRSYAHDSVNKKFKE